MDAPHLVSSACANLVVPLHPHPDTLCPDVSALVVRVVTDGQGALHLTYTLQGRPDGLPVPAPRPPRRVDGLWRQTCFEAFVAPIDTADSGVSGYHEFNFSPSGEWAAYGFRRYREGAPLATARDPGIRIHRTRDTFELGATLAPDGLPMCGAGASSGGRFRLALSAVIEDSRGALSYWALRHPPGKPDFHHAAAFALLLDPASTAIITAQP